MEVGLVGSRGEGKAARAGLELESRTCCSLADTCCCVGTAAVTGLELWKQFAVEMTCLCVDVVCAVWRPARDTPACIKSANITPSTRRTKY